MPTLALAGGDPRLRRNRQGHATCYSPGWQSRIRRLDSIWRENANNCNWCQNTCGRHFAIYFGPACNPWWMVVCMALMGGWQTSDMPLHSCRWMSSHSNSRKDIWFDDDGDDIYGGINDTEDDEA
jgi:hypothetical protein